jgi:hypothetical protein
MSGKIRGGMITTNSLRIKYISGGRLLIGITALRKFENMF